MVKKRILSFIEKIIIFVSLVLVVLINQGCSSNGDNKQGYQVGDISKRLVNAPENYCKATNPETRAMLKAMLNSQGVTIGVDFCTAYGLSTIVLGGK
ncbi:hypothetical protein [Thalassotalea profundi]|uniref:Uncharacterized protein n=1 Tax=Thalassotalea profundi TaxID=2036687 RepID=A0ABQ3IN15_9GAMM|nr:hypothetical protein [Thalassotalea profundi]GHE87515.1 hypothetical protein GCM10011501_16250 [Thalassotalea profundi]